MLDRCQNAQERWGGVNILIDHWLKQRQRVIVLYCAVTGLEAYHANTVPLVIKVKAFCQILIDYISVGHFEIFEKLLEEGHEFNNSGGLEVARRLYPKIRRFTDSALDFNDKYDSDERFHQSFQELSKDLSHLGELLEERFEMEDKLIKVLHRAHQKMVA